MKYDKTLIEEVRRKKCRNCVGVFVCFIWFEDGVYLPGQSENFHCYGQAQLKKSCFYLVF